MKKLLLFIALLISGLGLNAQSVGDETIINYGSYSLWFSITSEEPAECEVVRIIGVNSSTKISIDAIVTIKGKEFSVTSIGSSVCSSNLTSIKIPSSITSIGERAFYGCSSLTSVVFGDNSQLTSIGSSAFSGCSSLTSVVFGDNSQLTSIGSSAFDGCSSLTSVVFGDNSQLTSIGSSAFDGCTSLTGIELSSSVTSVGTHAFRECSSLTSVIFGDNSQLTFIGQYAFADCSSLTSIDFGDNSQLASIEKGVFYRCVNLTSIDFGENSQLTSIGSSAFYGCSSLTSLEIPSSVTSIEGFGDCSSLTSVVFGDNSQLTSIGGFGGCSSLTSIEIPSGVTSIGSSAFSGCSSLTSVVFGDNSQLTSIGRHAFFGCSSLTSIEIPSSVTSIGMEAFWDCTSLIMVFCYIEDEDIINKLSNKLGNSPVEIIYVPENSVEIYRESSGWNQYVIRPIYAYIYTTIIDCEGYTGEFTATSLEPAECEVESAQLSTKTAIVIPSTVTIEGIEFSVTSIGKRAFYRCVNLTSIDFGENSQLTSIGVSAFSGCSSLTSLEIPSSVTSIDGFYGCSSLTSVTFGDNSQLTSIENGAFYGCSSLTSIEIPSGVTSIGMDAFGDCESLGKIICYAEQVPKTAKSAFGRNMVVYVPNSSIEIYKVTQPWSDFTILPITNKVKTSVNIENTGSVTGAGDYYYGEEVVLTATPNEGYKFVNWTENGEVVSENTQYSFVIIKDRNLVANFELINEVEDETTCIITAVANPEEAGTIKGTGTYVKDMTVKLTAVANEGYEFLNWTENDIIVSIDAEYLFEITKDRNLVANFEKIEEPEVPEDPENPEDPEQPGEGVEELTSSFNIYPNPVSDKLYIETQTQTLTVEIYDIYGRQQSMVNGQQSMVIDVTNLNSGVYFVKVVTSEGEAVKRIVKK